MKSVDCETYGASKLGDPEGEVGESVVEALDVVLEVVEAAAIPMESQRIWLGTKASADPLLHPRNTVGRGGGGGGDDGVTLGLERDH